MPTNQTPSRSCVGQKQIVDSRAERIFLHKLVRLPICTKAPASVRSLSADSARATVVSLIDSCILPPICVLHTLIQQHANKGPNSLGYSTKTSAPVKRRATFVEGAMALLTAGNLLGVVQGIFGPRKPTLDTADISERCPQSPFFGSL